jgi:hypothetical protein
MRVYEKLDMQGAESITRQIRYCVTMSTCERKHTEIFRDSIQNYSNQICWNCLILN